MLTTGSNATQFDLIFRSEWQDGYGAQGWKLVMAMADPEVIACTAYTGSKTPTSVLVHDMLDHLVSGFRLSGYADEARATAMHGLRNGIEVRSSYEWMADEILRQPPSMNQLADLLPASTGDLIPAQAAPHEAVALLLDRHGAAEIRRHVVEALFRVGLSGIPIALSNWRERRLDFGSMHAIGLCLQALLVEAQGMVTDWAAEAARGRVFIGNDACEFHVATDTPLRRERVAKLVG